MIARAVTLCLVLCLPAPRLAAKAPPDEKKDPVRTLRLGPGDHIITRTEDGIGSVVFSPDGRLLATAGPGQSIQLWDVETHEELRRLEGHRTFIRTLAFSPDGK